MTPLFQHTLFKHKPFKGCLLAGLIISATSFYAPMLNAAPIYKVVDDKTGQVTFTDSPQSYEQQTGKQISQTGITTGNSTSANNNSPSSRSTDNNTSANASSTSTTNTQAATVSAEVTAKSVQVDYQLTMTEPSEERAYRRPAQSINVSIQTKPALQAGDNVSIYLDSNAVAQGLKASIATIDILPGEHSVQAIIKNKEGQVLKQISRTVYVIQNTLTLQNNNKIAQQLLAYQRLPWHQKVLLKLRQDNINQQQVNKQQTNK